MDNNTTEKITINTNVVDLGYIDLLVSEGFYSNRTDFIRTAIRNQLSSHSNETKMIVQRKKMIVGIVYLTENELILASKKDEVIEYKVIGMLVISDKIPLELLKNTVSSITVHGILRCRSEIKEHY